MKRLALLAAFLLTSSVIHAQEKMVSIPESQLSDKQKAEVIQRDLQDRVSQYGKWVGVGHEVGVAVNEGLSAVSNQANNFAQTPVGKWTIAVVIFKVIGAKAMGYLIGLSMFAVGVPIWIWSYRKWLPKKYLVEITYDPATGKRLTAKYGYGYASDGSKFREEQATEWAIGHWVIFAVFTVLAFAVMFTGD